MYRADCIVACATAPGRGAIAIVRISGGEAGSVLGRIFRPSKARSLRPWRLVHGRVVDPDTGAELDEALAVLMPAPRSYTGEDCVEIQVHGSPLIVEQLVQYALRAGARLAERGEFTRRAVLNGRIDLLQAEAVADLIDARVEAGARAAWSQLQGALSLRLEGLRSRILAILAEVEAAVDFSDDEPQVMEAGAQRLLVDALCSDIAELLGGFAACRRFREGFRTTLVGRPNVGKSSLINALLGCGRMLVSDEPGTTRDTVEETVDLGGLAFVLVDTAGVRPSRSKAEQAAIERTRQAVSDADIGLFVVDGSTAITDEDFALLDETAAIAQRLVVVNKADLGCRILAAERVRLGACGVPVLEVSALTGAGCDELAGALISLASPSHARPPVGITRVRHRSALEGTAAALTRVAQMLDRQQPPELIAVDLRTALNSLAGVVEPVDNEDVLDVIFGEFCIGK